jgi:hypothetical protein
MQANAFISPTLSTELPALSEAETAMPDVQSGLTDADELANSEEMELAAELLGVQNEEELERFLGSLLSRTLEGASAFARSPAGQQALDLLKSTARRALPLIAQSLGDQMGGARGAQSGSRVAADAGRLFGLELEGLSHEDGEFEVARGFARLAHRSLRPLNPRRSTPLEARRSFRHAARIHAPGLFARSVWVDDDSAVPDARLVTGFPSSGRWVRHGYTITLR